MNTTLEVADRQRHTILAHLAGGKPVAVVGTILGITDAQVLDVAKHHGYPDLKKMQWAADILKDKIDNGPSELPASTLPQERPTAPRAPAATPASPTLTKPDEIRVLINTAKGHPSKRIQAAGDRVLDDVDRLKTLLREDQEKNAEKRAAEAAKQAASAEIARLEAELKEAKAKLRKTPPSSKAVTTTAEQLLECEQCGKPFATPQGLSLHRRRAHEA